MTNHPYTRLFILPSAPDENTDSSQGYEVGDVIHSAGGTVHICRDASDGAAVWQPVPKISADIADGHFLRYDEEDLEIKGYDLMTALALIYAPISKGVTGGDSHDHSGGDGAQIAHSSLSGIGTNTHPQIDTALGALAATYAPIVKGVTNGDSHDHNGGDGGTIAYSSLSGRPPLLMPWGVYTNISPMTTSPAAPYALTFERTTTFVKWTQSYFVQTTNNGSNYWTITIKRITDGATVATFNTSAAAADTWNQAAITSFSIASLGTANRGIYIECAKTGTPGPLYLIGPQLEVTV